MSNALYVRCSLCGDISHGIDAPSMVHNNGFYRGCVLMSNKTTTTRGKKDFNDGEEGLHNGQWCW
jgi:hypothetical protein